MGCEMVAWRNSSGEVCKESMYLSLQEFFELRGLQPMILNQNVAHKQINYGSLTKKTKYLN